VSSAAAAGAGVDVAITMVPTPEAVDQILFGPDGLAEALGPGQIYVDMSTIGPAAFRSIASGLPEGVQGVDAPVRGSVPEATAGTLQLFVGASDDAFQRVRPILATLGDVHHFGGPGSGAAMKLVSNLTLGRRSSPSVRRWHSPDRSGSTARPYWTSWPNRRSGRPSRPNEPTSRRVGTLRASSCASRPRTCDSSTRPPRPPGSTSPKRTPLEKSWRGPWSGGPPTSMSRRSSPRSWEKRPKDDGADTGSSCTQDQLGPGWWEGDVVAVRIQPMTTEAASPLVKPNLHGELVKSSERGARTPL
jgi:hypothetical protein